MGWTARNIPDQSGRTAVVTGANSGLGYVTARELARRGARVVLACRSGERGRAAQRRLTSEVPEADAEFRQLDLADLASVRAFAGALPGERIDLLVNNAGVMAVPYARTADGFESQIGINHLGHFALTGLLLERLVRTPGARVTTVSSMAHALGTFDLLDLNGSRSYRRWPAYGASKTANLLFTRELAGRAEGHGLSLTATAAHPGYADTALHTRAPRLAGRRHAERLMRLGSALAGAPADHGAACILHAATAPQAGNGSFSGPRILALRGGPAPSWCAPWARDDRAAGLLWDTSERLTGVTYAFP